MPWGDLTPNPGAVEARREEQERIAEAVRGWEVSHSASAWAQLEEACQTVCFPGKALEARRVALLPVGWEFQACDEQGCCCHNEKHLVAVGPEKQRTSVHMSKFMIAIEAWQIATPPDAPVGILPADAMFVQEEAHVSTTPSALPPPLTERERRMRERHLRERRLVVSLADSQAADDAEGRV